MKIAIDITPLKDELHSVRGSGFYLNNLKNSLEEYQSQNKYTFFTRGEKIPDHPNVVHYPYFEPFFNTLPSAFKIPTVVTVHDLTPLVFPKEFPSGLKGKLRWLSQKRKLRKTQAIITDSFASKSDIVRIAGIPESKVHVVYLAAGEEFKKLPSGEWEKEIRRKYNLPEKFVFYAGDVTWNKNVPRLIAAALKADIPLVLVGKAFVQRTVENNQWNKDLIEVQHLIKNNGNITALGFVSTDELVQLYNIATVFAFPSLYEGFGLPVLEAMACGCPVVTSDAGSLKEVAGNAVQFVDPKSENSIAEGLQEVFEDSNLQRKLSKKGLEHVKKFSWEKTAKGTIEVYKKVI